MVELELVLFKPEGDLFENIVDDANDKVLMISVESTDQDGQEVNVSVFDLDRLAKNSLQNVDDLGLLIFGN